MVAVPVELVFVWGSFVDHLLDQQEVFCYVLHCLWWFFSFLKNKRESRSVATFQEKNPHKGFRAHRSIGQYHIYIETLCCQDGNS